MYCSCNAPEILKSPSVILKHLPDIELRSILAEIFLQSTKSGLSGQRISGEIHVDVYDVITFCAPTFTSGAAASSVLFVDT